MPEKVTITLEGKDFQVTVPLTIGQLEDLQVATALPFSQDPQENVRRDFKQSIGIVLAATSLENPALTEEAFRKMRIAPAELNAAVSKVLHASGLVTKKADAPGEVVAAAA